MTSSSSSWQPSAVASWRLQSDVGAVGQAEALQRVWFRKVLPLANSKREWPCAAIIWWELADVGCFHFAFLETHATRVFFSLLCLCNLYKANSTDQAWLHPASLPLVAVCGLSTWELGVRLTCDNGRLHVSMLFASPHIQQHGHKGLLSPTGNLFLNLELFIWDCWMLPT